MWEVYIYALRVQRVKGLNQALIFIDVLLLLLLLLLLYTPLKVQVYKDS